MNMRVGVPTAALLVPLSALSDGGRGVHLDQDQISRPQTVPLELLACVRRVGGVRSRIPSARPTSRLPEAPGDPGPTPRATHGTDNRRPSWWMACGALDRRHVAEDVLKLRMSAARVEQVEGHCRPLLAQAPCGPHLRMTTKLAVGPGQARREHSARPN